VLFVWQQRTTDVKEGAAEIERRVKAVQTEAGSIGRSVRLRAVHRSDELRSAARQTARGSHARPNRPPRRVDRRGRRTGHPGVCRARSTARRRSLGAGVAEPEAAASTAVPSRRNRVRRKPI
jgi:hypothetical protein